MRERIWKARIRKLVKEEQDQPERMWYLSFADERGFLGGIIIKAHGFTEAMIKSHAMKINPGGEVQGCVIPEEHIPPKEYHNRLLTKEQFESFWGKMRKNPGVLTVDPGTEDRVEGG
jgi:hypothetical protein